MMRCENCEPGQPMMNVQHKDGQPKNGNTENSGIRAGMGGYKYLLKASEPLVCAQWCQQFQSSSKDIAMTFNQTRC
eukprot:COSAG01_NODE_1102_length_11682_cov_11.201848_4_plen_76_part_00